MEVEQVEWTCREQADKANYVASRNVTATAGFALECATSPARKPDQLAKGDCSVDDKSALASPERRFAR